MRNSQVDLIEKLELFVYIWKQKKKIQNLGGKTTLNLKDIEREQKTKIILKLGEESKWSEQEPVGGWGWQEHSGRKYTYHTGGSGFSSQNCEGGR